MKARNLAIANARTAGVLYLIVILTGLFSEMFVRSGIIVPGDADATAANITENEFLFRLGLVSDLFMVMSDLGLALLFYLLLKPVNQGLSLPAFFFGWPRLRFSTLTFFIIICHFYFWASAIISTVFQPDSSTPFHYSS